MPDRADHRSFDETIRTATLPQPDAEAARLRFAATRIRALESIEQRLLDQAVRAPDDTQASWLELWADTAWRDAHALRAEHTDHPSQEPS